jgi:hypothetical protein
MKDAFDCAAADGSSGQGALFALKQHLLFWCNNPDKALLVGQMAHSDLRKQEALIHRTFTTEWHPSGWQRLLTRQPRIEISTLLLSAAGEAIQAAA